MYREALQVRARENRRLPRLHLACARSLGDRRGRRAGVAERLGRHLLMAGEAVEATGHLLAAAEERLAHRQLDQTERLLDVRREALRRLGVPLADPLWGAGPVVRTRMLRARGTLDAARAEAEGALERAREHGWISVLARLLCELSELDHAGGALKTAWRRLEEAEPIARRTNQRSLLAQLHQRQGTLLRLRGEVEHAQERVLEAREHFLRAGDPVRAAGCLVELAVIAAEQGFTDEANRRATQARTACDEAGDRLGAARAQVVLGDVARRMDRADEALVAYAEAEARYRRAGARLPPAVPIGRALLRKALVGPKRAAAALEALEAELDAPRDRPALGGLQVHLLAVRAAQGDRKAWDDHMTAARKLLVETGTITLDMARAAEEAARLADTAGWSDAARSAAGLAAVQFTRLGCTDDAARCKGLLAPG